MNRVNRQKVRTMLARLFPNPWKKYPAVMETPARGAPA